MRFLLDGGARPEPVLSSVEGGALGVGGRGTARRRRARTRSEIAFHLSFLVAVASIVLPGHAGASPSLSAALQHPGLRGAKVGTLVVRADDGAVLFAQRENLLLAPASNLKVLTAVAALATFGPTHRFTTTVYGDSVPGDTGDVGRLWVRGGGDPALTSEEWWRLAGDLRLAGVRRVSGDVILDDTFFDDQRWNPAWGDRSARAFHASVSALTANYGAFTVAVRPGASGRPAYAAIDPPVPYLLLSNRTITAAGGKPLDVNRQAGSGVEEVIVSGTVSADSPTSINRSVLDPTLYAGAVLRMQLAANGIAVTGAARRGPVPADARELLQFRGKPLADVVRLMMKYSNNNIAEMLIKDMGADAAGPPGSWPNGLAALRSRLTSLGVDLSGSTLFDGSGLAAESRITPRVLVDVLRAARRSFAFGPELTASLPIAGRDGTLQKRAATALDFVRAKTGLLATATGLSGYARLSDGAEVVFSVLVNDFKSDADAIAALDVFISTLVRLGTEDLTPRVR